MSFKSHCLTKKTGVSTPASKMFFFGGLVAFLIALTQTFDFDVGYRYRRKLMVLVV